MPQVQPLRSHLAELPQVTRGLQLRQACPHSFRQFHGSAQSPYSAQLLLVSHTRTRSRRTQGRTG